MSEKRFVLIEDDLEPLILDNKETMSVNEVVDVLNEQQATISQLEEENDKLIQKNCIPCELVNLQTREIDKLKEENEQLKEELNNLKKDETMLYHYYTLARYGGDGV